jgi:hypothetical protein
MGERDEIGTAVIIVPSALILAISARGRGALIRIKLTFEEALV